MKRLTVDTIYSNYPLYKVMYGRPVWYQQHTAHALLHMIGEWMFKSKVQSLNVLELFSGQGELIHPLTASGLPIRKYVNNDLSNFGGELAQDGFLLGDAYSASMRKNFIGTEANVVLLPYFSVQATAPVNHSYPSMEALTTLFKNCRAAIGRRKGMVYVHYDSMLSDLEFQRRVGNVVSSISIPPYHALRTSLGLHELKPATLYISTDTHYDRADSLLVDTFKEVWVEDEKGTTLATIKIRQPFYERYWSNSEICSALRQAEFDTFTWYETTNTNLNQGDSDLNRRPQIETQRTLGKYFTGPSEYAIPHHLIAC